MRIDATSLIAAQSAQRPTQAAPKPAHPGALGAPIHQGAADNPLFEPLIFPQTKAETAPAKSPAASPQTPPRRPGALIDITV